jgi:hypothetical protein
VVGLRERIRGFVHAGIVTSPCDLDAARKWPRSCRRRYETRASPALKLA